MTMTETESTQGRQVRTHADLTEREQLACALRVLADLDYNENFTGHITWQLAGTDELIVNPWGRWWNEVTASQLCRVTLDGTVLEGEFVTEAIFIHTELHRVREDARVVIHNHPRYGTLLATLGLLPEISHQAACIFLDQLALVDEYRGAVADSGSGAQLAAEIGAATGVVMANHGVLVTGADMAEAMFRAIAFERMCQLTVEQLQIGLKPRPIARDIARPVQDWLLRNGVNAYWDGAVRQLLERYPGVLL
jgi:ribulose-5-phosphate 4-epimerase/fuculose-1-phosphate aldolase